uniref:Minor structural protein n=1 Tax=Norovirus NLV/IF2036/2003/Iraq TaxID=286546 RepID=Q6B7R1_NORV|nr:minor structural protein [Norovirus NLV/IF2036/2003/Iraq]
MAQAIFGAIAATAAGSSVGAGIQAGTEAALQYQRYHQDLTLQQNSFKHDERMLGLQIEGSNALLQKNLSTRYNLLLNSGMSSADAARTIVGAPASKVVDWNGVRIAAPTSTATTLRSGNFMNIPVFQKTKQQSSSMLSSGYSNPNYDSSTLVSRTTQWVESQNSSRSLSPFHPSALRTTWVTPPGSTSTSTYSSVSSAPRFFNTERLPLFANNGRK